MSGIDFLNELRSLSIDAAERVVFTVEPGASEATVSQLQQQGRPFLLRPVELEEATRLVRERLRSS